MPARWQGLAPGWDGWAWAATEGSHTLNRQIRSLMLYPRFDTLGSYLNIREPLPRLRDTSSDQRDLSEGLTEGSGTGLKVHRNGPSVDHEY